MSNICADGRKIRAPITLSSFRPIGIVRVARMRVYLLGPQLSKVLPCHLAQRQLEIGGTNLFSPSEL